MFGSRRLRRRAYGQMRHVKHWTKNAFDNAFVSVYRALAMNNLNPCRLPFAGRAAL